MHDGPTPTPQDSLLIRQKVAEQLDIRKRAYSPSWLSLRGLVDVSSEPGSSTIWENLFEEVPAHIQRRLEAKGPLSYAATLLARQMGSFMTLAISTALLAAAEGTDGQQRRVPEQHRTLVRVIRERFPEPAETAEELISRMQQLVPNPDEERTSDDPTLLDYFKNHRAFETYHDFQMHYCPGVDLTEVIFDQWGRALHTDGDYLERIRAKFTQEEKPVPDWL